jgi:hypothetical protein
MQQVHKINGERTQNLILKHPELEENTDLDLNNIEMQMTIKFTLQTFKLILVIFNCSYFIGIIWIVFADAIERMTEHKEHEELNLEIDNEDHGSDTFIDAYNI